MDIDQPHVLAEVRAAFERYEAALTANDLPVLAELFWDSPLTLRYGAAEHLYGRDAIVAFRAARPAAPRPRTLMSFLITTFGSDTAVANAEFRNEGETRIGRQSQTWVRMPQGWRIVSAHVSYVDPQSLQVTESGPT